MKGRNWKEIWEKKNCEYF